MTKKSQINKKTLKDNKQVLGFWMLTALVTGNMIGSGIFLLPASLAQYGSISIFSWLVTAIGAILLALVFAKLSQVIPKVGGPYAYTHEAFGNFVGFEVAYNYWIALWVGNAGIALACVSYLSVFFPSLATNHFATFGMAALLVWSCTYINILGVHSAGIVQLLTTILKLIPLFLIAALGIFYIQPSYLLDHFNISGHSTFSALTSAAALTLWSFIGVESASVPAESVVAPEKNIPRATIIGTLLAAFVYIASTVAVMGMIPMHALANSTAPYADAAKLMLGDWGYKLVAVGAMISCFGALNGWTLLQGQVPLAAARDGLFPTPFAKESQNNTPVVGLLVSAVLITLLLLLTLHQSLVSQFTFIILLATFATLIPYAFTTIAEIIIYLKAPERFNGRRFLMSGIVASLAFIYSFWAMMGSGQDVVYYGALLFFSGIPLYAWMLWRHKQLLSKRGNS